MTDTARHSPSAPRVAAALVATMTASVLPVMMVGMSGAQIRRDLDLSEQLLGLVVGSYFLFATLASMSLGQTIKRLG